MRARVVGLHPTRRSRGGLLGLAFMRESGGSEDLDLLASIVALAAIALLTIRRWILIGPYPSGLDGAQWLALGRGLHGFGRATSGAFAPLTPMLATLMEAFAGPLLATRLLATVSGLAISLGVWLVARDVLGMGWGLAVSAFVIPASALAEPTFFGGYPQQLALAAGIIALWATCKYLIAGTRHALSFAGIASVVTASAHHIYFPLFAISILLATGFWFSGPTGSNKIPRARRLLTAMVPGFVIFAAVAFTFRRGGYAAPLEASARSIADAWAYGTREAPALWCLILLIGAASLAVEWRTRDRPGWLLSASLLLPAGLLFLISGQPRLLPPVIIGGGLAAGLGALRVSAIGSQARVTTFVMAATVAAWIIVSADKAASGFAEFYRVVDGSMVKAAAAIEADGGYGAVAVRQDRRGWPIGWWFEALLTQPIVVGSQAQWLAFPDELEHARLAEALFTGEIEPEAFRRRATTVGVRYVVIPKWDWIGWERWGQSPDFPVSTLYDDGRYLVLRVT